MSYYRPGPMRLVWGVVIALALALALWLAWRATTAAIRQDERATVLREGNALLVQAFAQGQRLAQERDSLAQLVRQRDTVIIERIRQAKADAARPMPPATDTTALVAAVRSCRAQLDTLATDCDAFRRTATTALAKADTIRRGDSTVIAGLSTQLAVIRRADSLKAAQLAGRSRWRTIERGVCVGSVAANIFTFTR